MEKRRIFSLRMIIPLGIILGLLIVFLWNQPKINYRSQMQILAIPRSQLLADNFSQVAGNLKQIPMTLGFYNKLLELYPDIEDHYAGMNPAERKALWNAALDVRQLGKSGVMEISIMNANQWQAELISQKVSYDIVTIANRYYNQNVFQLDFRVIENPIVSEIKTSRWKSLVIPAFIAGFLIAILISLVSGIIRSLFSSKEEPDVELSPGDIWKKYTEKEEPEVKTMESDIEKSKNEPEDYFSSQVAQKEIPLFVPATKIKAEKIQPDLTKKSKAPGNLPIASGEIPSIFNTVKNLDTEEKKPEDTNSDKPKDFYREASPEEVKERLNKLLRGE